MRCAFWTEEGSTLSWARRLVDEGASVLVYHAKKHARRIGVGIVPITENRDEWIKWGMADRETIFFFDCTNNGDIADHLRTAGRYVVGGGGFADELEMDREFGQSFAAKHGIQVPPTQSFGSVSDAIAHMHSTKQTVGDGGWAWKPDKDLGPAATMVGDTEQVTSFCERSIIPKHGNNVSCIVQERIKGVAISTARWWNGHQWTGPYEGTIEEKALMDGDFGPATGCSLNTVWFYLEENPLIAQALRWDWLAESFRAHNAPPGIYDINAVVNGQAAYFLEWTPRLGIDAELTSQRGFTNLSELLTRVAHGDEIDDLFRVDTGYHAVRLTVPPYPVEHESLANEKIALGVAIEGITSLWQGPFVMVGVQLGKHGFEVADPYGFVGSCVVENRSVAKGYEQIAQEIRKLRIANLQCRTDGAKIVTADIHEMKKYGWTTTPYLTEGER